MSVEIIAEAGVNHNGDLEKAKKLIYEASYAGANYIKFQSFITADIISKKAPKAEYQKIDSSDTETQYDMVKKLELSKSMHFSILKHCKKNNINFLSTAFDIKSFIFLKNQMKIEKIKIPSGEITNLPFLRYLGKQKLPILLSTGMSTLKEIDNAVNILLKSGLNIEKLTILHCNTSYPTPYIDANINAMLSIKKKFGTKVGYSDHTPGIEASIAAVAIGAETIEKHFTLNKNLKGPDHKASLSLKELGQLIKSIRNTEKLMGTGLKKPTKSEYINITVARKSIVAARKIKIGEIFTKDNLICKRPGNGISPMLWDKIIGKKSKFNFTKDECIKL